MTVKDKLNIAILGATGLVGETILEILHARKFPVAQLYPLASENSAGETVVFANRNYQVLDAADFDFSQAHIAIFSAGSAASKKYAPIAAESNCVVIDNTSQFRNDVDVPLIIPEINAEQIKNYKRRNIIANPNCSTIQMLMAIYPIYQAVGISEINVATYQSVSGSGKQAISELIEQTGTLLNGRPTVPEVYPQQIAFNVIPHIDELLDNGYSKEEMKMLWETRKILDDERIRVNATTVRVPVIYGHSEAITINTKQPMLAKDAVALLEAAPGLAVIADLGKYPTPFADATGNDSVFVGRLRNTMDNTSQLQMWVVADNIRKGAALNSVQIAEQLVNMLEH